MIQHPWSNIHDPTSMIQHPWSNIHDPTFMIQHPWSNMHDATFMIQHPWSNFHDPTSMIQHPWSNIHDPTSLIHHPWSYIHCCHTQCAPLKMTVLWQSSVILNTRLFSTFNCGFICEYLIFVQYKTKTKQKVCGFQIFFRAFLKFYKNKKLLNTNF